MEDIMGDDDAVHPGQFRLGQQRGAENRVDQHRVRLQAGDHPGAPAQIGRSGKSAKHGIRLVPGAAQAPRPCWRQAA
jgi:hypothetical protein